MKKLLLLLCLTTAIVACHPNRPDSPGNNPNDSVPSDTVPPMPVFSAYVGGDISLLPAYEAANTPYKGRDGQLIPDLITYLRDTCRWNSARVRLFVDPVIVNADGSRQGEVQDLAYVTALGQRIKQAGMAFMLDFHYSDTWADPVKQYIPARWSEVPDEILPDTVYAYTKHCLQTLVAAGATPDLIQIGNEISYGMLWRGNPKNSTDPVHAYDDAQYEKEINQWIRFGNLLKKAAEAVREVCPNAQIVIHIERTAMADMCKNFFTYLTRQEVPFDVIGLSYYPFWHGWLNTQLPATLSALHSAFPNTPIQIVETAYYNAYWPSSGISYDTRKYWPATPAGQDAYLADLIATLRQYDYVNGLFYWFPEENGCGGNTWNANKIVITSWLNRGLFNPADNQHQAYPGLYRLSDFID